MRDAPMKSEFVYFVEAKVSGLIKIGVARDMQRRLATLQCGSPEPLEVVAVIPEKDARDLEGWLHSQFRVERRHGEWFEASERLVNFIVENGMTLKAYDEHKRAAMLADWVERGVVAHLPEAEPIKGNSRQARLARYKARRGLDS